MNSSRDGILQFRNASLVTWNVERKIEYSIPKFYRMERINFSSFFSIPHCLSKSTSELNLVMNCSMVSNSLSLNDINSFSNWCPLSSSCFSKKDSSLIHNSLGHVQPSRWKSSSRERERENNPFKLHPSYYATLLSQQLYLDWFLRP